MGYFNQMGGTSPFSNEAWIARVLSVERASPLATVFRSFRSFRIIFTIEPATDSSRSKKRCKAVLSRELSSSSTPACKQQVADTRIQGTALS